MNTRTLSRLASIAAAALFICAAGCFISKKETVHEPGDTTVVKEKEVIHEPPAKEKVIIREHD